MATTEGSAGLLLGGNQDFSTEFYLTQFKVRVMAQTYRVGYDGMSILCSIRCSTLTVVTSNQSGSWMSVLYAGPDSCLSLC